MSAAGEAAAQRLLALRDRAALGGPPAPVATATATVERCTRCGIPAERLIPAYWAPERVRLCRTCCAEVAAEFDARVPLGTPVERAWPAAGRWTPTRIEHEDRAA